MNVICPEWMVNNAQEGHFCLNGWPLALGHYIYKIERIDDLMDMCQIIKV
jgi:hypothetical protein